MNYRLSHRIKLANLRSSAERVKNYIQGSGPGQPGQNFVLGPNSKLSQSINSSVDKLYSGPVKAGKMLIDPILQAPMNVLLGNKSMYGAYKGSRKKSAPRSGKGLMGDYIPIDAGTARSIRAGDIPGEVTSVFHNTPLGKKEHFLARKSNYGGLVGFAQRRPLVAAGGGLLAYILATNPQLRQTAAGFIPGMPQNKIAPDVLKQFSQQPSMQDPFASGAWK